MSTEALATALRLLGDDATVNPDATLAEADALLAPHGLRLAVVAADVEPVQLASEQLIVAAISRAAAAGEPERGLQSRIARLCGRDRKAVQRALNRGAELDGDARARLIVHLLDPVKHPLPAAGVGGRPRKPGGRADRKAARATDGEST